MILPGSTLGVLGGGQLGRMFGQAAQSLGYRVHVYEPAADCPASAVANRTFTAPYEDAEQLAAFARSCAVVTYEFVFEGITMTSSTVVKGNPEMSAREAAKWVNRYPAGTETAGYLNGDNPNDVVLARDNDFRLPLAVAAFGIVALAFLLWEDRAGWLPGYQRADASSSASTWVDPRGRPPELNMKPPPGMEGAIWDPSPGEDGLPRGWVRPDTE